MINWEKVCLELSSIFDLPKLEPYDFCNSPFTDNITYFNLGGRKLKSKRERRNQTNVFFSNGNGQFTSLLNIDKANKGKAKRITSFWHSFKNFNKESYWLMCYVKQIGFGISRWDEKLSKQFSNHELLEFHISYNERLKEVGLNNDTIQNR